jgi:hypothetical protein
VVGGYVVTGRMLKMFRRRPAAVAAGPDGQAGQVSPHAPDGQAGQVSPHAPDGQARQVSPPAPDGQARQVASGGTSS